MNEILLYGPIGEDFWEPENAITAKSVMNQLAEIDGDVTVRISSGGGDVYAGVDIMNALKNHPGEVTVIVESLAASAASFIAVGGADRVLARESSELMLHRAWTFTDGNADDVRKTLADLERQDVKLANIYAGKAGGSVDDWLAVMSAETWYTAEEALAAGLVDEIIAAPAKAAPAPPVAMARKRFKFANRAAAPPPPATRSVSGGENNKPSFGQEGDVMSIQNLAQELGVEPDQLREKLAGFFNESVEVTAPVQLTYPDEVTVVPTGKVEVAPTEPLPAGVVPEATVGDGFTAEVAEDGSVTVRASDQVSVDDTADLVLAFGDTSVTVAVKVVAADAEEEAPVTGEPAPVGPAPEQGGNTAEFGEVPNGYALVPQAHLDDLTARAQMGDQAFNAKAEADLKAEVDQWVKEGRFAAARRDKVLASMRDNPEMTRKTWGNLPVNSIPRGELGYGVDPHDPEESGKSSQSLIAKANHKKNKA